MVFKSLSNNYLVEVSICLLETPLVMDFDHVIHFLALQLNKIIIATPMSLKTTLFNPYTFIYFAQSFQYTARILIIVKLALVYNLLVNAPHILFAYFYLLISNHYDFMYILVERFIMKNSTSTTDIKASLI